MPVRASHFFLFVMFFERGTFIPGHSGTMQPRLASNSEVFCFRSAKRVKGVKTPNISEAI